MSLVNRSEEKVAVSVKDIAKHFAPSMGQRTVKQAVTSLFKFRKSKTKNDGYWALKDINFDVKNGEFFGIVGRNGSGKSTLLKMIAGVYTPSKGAIQINGKLVPFIELGVGFNPELSGRDNVFLNGALLGFNRKEMSLMYEEIVDFAELEDHMDVKLKNFSSGMQVRLAFSIAIRARADVLLIDEVLAVGDALFQKKCYDYFKSLKKNKKTVLFVSHDTSALLEYCDRGALIENGELAYVGKISSVVNKYTKALYGDQGGTSMRAKDMAESEHIGTGMARIHEMAMYSKNGKETYQFDDKDEHIIFKLTVTATADIEDPVYGLTIVDGSGQRIFAGNNMWSQQKMPNIENGSTVQVVWTVQNIFNNGTFTVTPAIASNRGSVVIDQVDEIVNFNVRKRQISNAYANIGFQMEIE